jgi:hypothetical protein
MLRSGEIEAIKVNYFGPGRHEVLDKLVMGVRASVDLGQSSELGVRTEDEIDTRAGPLDYASLEIAPFKHASVFRDRLPLCAHVEQVHEEVVGERLRVLGEDAQSTVFGVIRIGMLHRLRRQLLRLQWH